MRRRTYGHNSSFSDASAEPRSFRLDGASARLLEQNLATGEFLFEVCADGRTLQFCCNQEAVANNWVNWVTACRSEKSFAEAVRQFLPEEAKEITAYCGAKSGREVDKAKAEHPGALFAVHPECEDEVVVKADFVGSTSQIIDWCVKTDAEEFIIGTEVGVVDRLSYYHPEKKYHLLTPFLVCPNMKKTELPDVLETLRDEKNEVTMTEEEIEAAKRPLERMVAIK